MVTFNSQASEFHTQLADEYISHIKDSGIHDAATFFERVNAFEDGRITEEKIVRDHLEGIDFPLESFYRVAPTIEQDVMMATLNPGMQNRIDLGTFTEGEYWRQQNAGKNLEAKAEIVARHLNGFLTHHANVFDDLINILREELDLMDSSGTLEEYVNCSADSVLDGFFGDVCYSWMYKLSTPDDSYIDDIGGPSRSFARQRFGEEIFEVVNPDVLVCVGKEGWKTVWNYLDSPEEQIEPYSDKSPVKESFHPKLEKGAYSGLYRIESEDLWILTTWHASYWIKSDRLRENARMLNAVL